MNRSTGQGGLIHQIIEKSHSCHACDGRTNGGGKWKMGQCSVGPETAIIGNIIFTFDSIKKRESIYHSFFLCNGNDDYDNDEVYQQEFWVVF